MSANKLTRDKKIPSVDELISLVSELPKIAVQAQYELDLKEAELEARVNKIEGQLKEREIALDKREAGLMRREKELEERLAMLSVANK